MKKKLLISIPIIIAIIAFICVYRYYNKEDKNTTLTVTEKRWVQDNSEKEYDFEVVNDYPLYGLNGAGVIYRRHPEQTFELLRHILDQLKAYRVFVARGLNM